MGNTQRCEGVLTGGYWACILMSVVEEGQYNGIRAPVLLVVWGAWLSNAGFFRSSRVYYFSHLVI